ncbi:hypothetical protein R1sor_020193 [Riccia sorocarpa]|uniref:Amine oxidase domain-containing protein n=1 Tax=Riccia sorocarpa TaxID=122646 RepID=A0ABD3IFC5_9MARC
MAGIAAAHRLQSSASSHFSLTILEASDRIGGRICSRELGGETVELGATWIHGIDGNPIFEIASRIGAMDGADQPWEQQDGFLHDELVRTEGGEDMEDSIVGRVADFFNDLLHEMKDERNFRALPYRSVGDFLRSRFRSFLADQQSAAQSADRPWGDVELQQAEAIFRNKEHMERLITAADSLSDLDMAGYQEYTEFNGEHRTVAKGYSTVVRELSRVLPDGAIQFRKKVKRIRWNQEVPTSLYPVTIFCEDGSMEQADHVILTVSLGVLKLAAKVTVSEKKERGVVNAANDALTDTGFFDPPLPEWKLDPIAKLGFGVVNKVFAETEPANGTVHKALRFIFKPENEEQERETLAATASAGGCSPLLRKSHHIYPINKKSHVLVTWITGREALLSESQTEDDLVKEVTGTLETFSPYPVVGIIQFLHQPLNLRTAFCNCCLLERRHTGDTTRPSTVLTLPVFVKQVGCFSTMH